MSQQNRRDVGARKIGAFQRLAAALVRTGLTPNQVSVASAFFGILAGVSLAYVPGQTPLLQVGLLVLAIFGIQFRLVCNLIDGLMAVEGGLKTASGEIFNDFPDRISDAAVMIGAGFVAASLQPVFFHLGWIAALMAVMTAYVRCLGAAMTGTHDFAGPMAKQHRMFVLTVASLWSIVEAFGVWPLGWTMAIGLMIVAAGSLLTVINRLRRLYMKLEAPK